jgi:hypothetical protein
VAFDNPDFGRKNYEEYLRAAKETLALKYLTPGDRRILERGIYHVEVAHDRLLKRKDPEALRDAYIFMTGSIYLGSRTLISESQREYWRRKSCGAGGGKEDAPQQQRKVWEEYVREWRKTNFRTRKGGSHEPRLPPYHYAVDPAPRVKFRRRDHRHGEGDRARAALQRHGLA